MYCSEHHVSLGFYKGDFQRAENVLAWWVGGKNKRAPVGEGGHAFDDLVLIPGRLGILRLFSISINNITSNFHPSLESGELICNHYWLACRCR